MTQSRLLSGERIVRCLIGEKIDRIPYGIGLGWQPWGETLTRWKIESNNPNLEPAVDLDFDCSFALPELNSGIYPLFEREIISETEDYIVYKSERGITMRDLKAGGSMPEWLDYPVKSESDWETLKNERLRLDNAERVVQNWDDFKLKLYCTGEAVQVGVYPYGVFGTVRDLLGVEEMLVSFYTNPEMMHDMMNHLTDLWIHLWSIVSKHVQINHIHIWEDMSGKQGSLISPKMIEQFMMPCYDRIVEFGKSVGVHVFSVDTDGDCSELIPIMTKHGINMFFPFEVQAGNDILEYRKMYPELGIIGGLDKRALAKTKSDIDAEVAKAKEMIKLGRYVPAFDHLIPPDVSWENFRYASEKIREICNG